LVSPAARSRRPGYVVIGPAYATRATTTAEA
jgi:hypothetical protein